MSDLPAPVAEAGLLFHRPSVIKDAEAMRQVIAWGHEQIDVAYPEDPIRAPLNVIRRRPPHIVCGVPESHVTHLIVAAIAAATCSLF